MDNNLNKINKQESKESHYLSVEEIRGGLDEIMGGRPYKMTKKLEDEHGIYRAEFETTEGNVERYSYDRKNGPYSEVTCLERFWLNKDSEDYVKESDYRENNILPYGEDAVDFAEIIAEYYNGKWHYQGRYKRSND